MGVQLQLRLVAQHRPFSHAVPQKDARHAMCKFGCNLVERQKMSRSGWAFHFEVLAIVVMELLQRLDDEEIEREPDGPTPVGIAAELPRLRFGRGVAHRLVHVAHVQLEGVLEMPLRQSTHAVLG